MDLKKVGSNSNTVLKAEIQLTAVCTCVFLAHPLSVSMNMKVGGKKSKHECAACRAMGIWGEKETGGGSERKVEMLPGGPHGRPS